MRHEAVSPFGRTLAGQVILVLIVGTLVKVSATVPTRQTTCPPSPSPTTQSAILKVKKADNTCTVADGGYVKTWTLYRLHINAQVTGSCGTSQRQCTGLPPVCQCVPSLTYIRTLLTSYLRTNGSLEGAVAADPSNDPSIQNYDTETSTNTQSTGASFLASTEGQFLYTSVTNAAPTPCDLEPKQFPQNQPGHHACDGLQA